MLALQTCCSLNSSKLSKKSANVNVVWVWAETDCDDPDVTFFYYQVSHTNSPHSLWSYLCGELPGKIDLLWLHVLLGTTSGAMFDAWVL